MCTEFCWGNLREIDHLENPGIDGDKIKTGLHEVGWGMDWIDLVQNKDRWRALMNAVMNFGVP